VTWPALNFSKTIAATETGYIPFAVVTDLPIPIVSGIWIAAPCYDFVLYIPYVYFLSPLHHTKPTESLSLFWEKSSGFWWLSMSTGKERYWYRRILYLYIYSIVNPIYININPANYFFDILFSLSFFRFSSFCLHFSASQLLAVIYKRRMGGFRWRELKLNGAEKKRDFPMEKKKFRFPLNGVSIFM
jgi:hypothetical protein